MSASIAFPAGGYRYLRGPFQYSGGVAAEPGFRIVRARFRLPLPLAEGFAAAEAHLAAQNRPTSAFAACELRSPAPFTDAGFSEFNRAYVQTLVRWGLCKDEANPVARTNVCPVFGAPAAPGFYAFSYTVPGPAGSGDFVLSGGGEVRDGAGSYVQRTVRWGETTPAAMREKINFVMGKMENRLGLLGFGWSEALAARAYTVHPIDRAAAEEIFGMFAGRVGLEWHFARPPLDGLEFEMDVRSVTKEIVL